MISLADELVVLAAFFTLAAVVYTVVALIRKRPKRKRPTGSKLLRDAINEAKKR